MILKITQFGQKVRVLLILKVAQMVTNRPVALCSGHMFTKSEVPVSLKITQFGQKVSKLLLSKVAQMVTTQPIRSHYPHGTAT